MTKRSVQYTGNIFASQRYGGISRYVLELTKNIQSSESWSACIEAPLFINEYLRAARASISHKGLYLHRRPIALDRLNFAAAWLSQNSGFRQSHTVRHEMFFNARNLEKCDSIRVSTFYDMIAERFNLSSQDSAKKKMRTAQGSDAIVAISESTKTDIVDILGVPPERIKVIYLAADTVPTTTSPQFAPTYPYILWVGHRDGYKNFDLLARAFPLTRAYRDGVKILLAGGKPPSNLENTLWSNHGLPPKAVHYTTPSDLEIADLYSVAQMLVYCSSFEGFGIPPLEAMQCHCPVICSNTSSLPEVVGNAAIQIPPDDVDQLVVAIDSVYESQELRRDLVQRGIANSKRFSWRKCAREHIELYNALT